MRFLRTNTAVVIAVGPFLDKADGVTLETGLTISNERITLVAETDDGNAPTNVLDNVTGATSGTSNDLNYITGNDAGMMQLELSAANTNRLGRMILTITDAANHAPVFHEFMVLPAMIYDAFVAGTDRLDTNVTHIADTSQTARDVGASVLLSAGTGTGQLDFTSGVVKSNLAQILGTALTETAGQIAAGFKKFFNVATPSGTVNSIPDATAGAAGGLFIAGTNAATTVTTSLTTTFTGNLTGSVGSVTGAVGSVTGAVGSVTGAVGSVTGNVGGNVVGSVGSVVGAVGSVTGNVGGNVAGSVASVTAGVTVTTNNDKTGYRLSATGVDDILDEVYEGTTTFRQALRGITSALLSKASGLETTTAVYRDIGDTKDRITATVDADGNRTAITLDLT